MATGGAAIGSLRVTLGLDSANFEAGTKRARNEAAKTATSIKSSFNGLSTALSGFVAGIGVSGILAAAKAGLEYASSLGEVAQQLGVTSNDLQIYRSVAGEVGITQDEMDKGLQKLTVSIGKAAAGSKAQAETFRSLGIAVVDVNGRVRTAGEIIPRLSDALSKIKDPATRARIEVELFGKTGQKLDTLLAGGSKAIDGLAEAYRKFGAILTPEQIKNADDAADTLQRIKTILSAKVAGWAADAAPGIMKLVSALEELGNLPNKYPRLFQLLALVNKGAGILNAPGNAINALSSQLGGKAAPSAADVKAGLDQVYRARDRVNYLKSAGSDKIAMNEAKAAFADAYARSKALSAAYNQAHAGLAAATGATADGALPDDPNAKLPRAGRAAKAAKQEVDWLSESMKDLNDNLNGLTSSNNSIFDDLTNGVVREPDDALSKAMGAVDKRKEAEIDAADEVSQHKHEVEQNNIQQLAGLYQSLFTGGTKGFLDSLRQMGLQVIAELAAKWTMSMIGGGGGGGGGGGIGGLLGGLFGGGGGGGGGLGSIFGSSSGGAMWETGAIPAFATGGSFRVGGTGAIDSKLMQFRATPGEMIDVRKPGNDNGRARDVRVIVEANEYFDARVADVSTPIAQREGGRGAGAAVQSMDRRRRTTMGSGR